MTLGVAQRWKATFIDSWFGTESVKSASLSASRPFAINSSGNDVLISAILQEQQTSECML